jgi:shikimate kinase
MKDSLFLAGFMGSGKSTVGKYLAKWLSRRYLDLDQCIERLEGRKVATIFEEEGEPYFREVEGYCLQQTPSMAVISLGGGAWFQESNRRWIGENGRSIALMVSFHQCWSRIHHSRKRPLVQNFGQVKMLYQHRYFHYQLADFLCWSSDLESSKNLAWRLMDSL